MTTTNTAWAVAVRQLTVWQLENEAERTATPTGERANELARGTHGLADDDSRLARLVPEVFVLGGATPSDWIARLIQPSASRNFEGIDTAHALLDAMWAEANAAYVVS